jgi:hypothetical protein
MWWTAFYDNFGEGGTLIAERTLGDDRKGSAMNEMTPREILDAIGEGLEETALLLTVLGYDAMQGRPGRHLLNNALERRGFGRPIDEQQIDKLQAYRPYPDEWVRAIAQAVTGRPDAPLDEVITTLKQQPVAPTTGPT